jgi:hypothetical protein
MSRQFLPEDVLVSIARSGAERTATGDLVGTDRRQVVFWRRRQSQKLIHDAENQLQAIDHREFAMEALRVRMDCAPRDAEIGSNGDFGAVVKHGAQDLKLPTGKSQASRYGTPSLLADDARTRTARASGLLDRVRSGRWIGAWGKLAIARAHCSSSFLTPSGIMHSGEVGSSKRWRKGPVWGQSLLKHYYSLRSATSYLRHACDGLRPVAVPVATATRARRQSGLSWP